MDAYSQAISQIIEHQMLVIGPIAFEQAKKVNGLKIESNSEVKIAGDAKSILGKLVEQYASLFGKASIEVCKEAVKESRPTIPHDELPDILK